MLKLNKEQLMAAEHSNGPALILAGPGTGKTTTLVGRFLYLLKQGVKPEEIICCTFARKAADEIKKRIKLETGVETKFLPIGTFHSLGLKALSSLGDKIHVSKNPEIIMQGKRIQIVNNIKDELIESNNKFKNVNVMEILHYIDTKRDALIDPEDASIEASEDNNHKDLFFSECYQKFEETLTKQKLIDYPRMIQFSCKALEFDALNEKTFIQKFKHILIDEYQDINFSQKTMVDLLLKGGADLWVVGDDDQAIYQWRGSRIGFILNFEKNYKNTTKVNLKINYRSTKNIVKVANNLSNHFRVRHQKSLVALSEKNGFAKVMVNQTDKIEINEIISLIENKIKNNIALNEIAVLSRTHQLPEGIILHLILKKIPVFVSKDMRLFQSYEVKNLLTAVAIANEIPPEKHWNNKIPPKLFGFSKNLAKDNNWKNITKALATWIINNLSSNLDDNELEEKVSVIEEHKDFLNKFENPVEAFNAIRNTLEQGIKQDGVYIGTIHSAKGLEWNTVFIIGCEVGYLPHYYAETPIELEEERRLMYVGITRAKETLILSTCKKRYENETEISPYIYEINKNFSEFDKRKELPNPRRKNFADDFKRLAKEIDQEQQKDSNLSKTISSPMEDGNIYGNRWEFINTEDGFLLAAGYTVKKGGPNGKERQAILSDVFQGKIPMPETIRKSVAEKWGYRNSPERLQKIRNNIKVSLGSQKGRANPSLQAIKKWEEDLYFIDQELKVELV